MALNQLPATESTIQVVHSGPTDGASFTTTLDASDGSPMSNQRVFTFDLSTFAPDMVDVHPNVEVFHNTSGDKVEADIKVGSSLITITFFEDVDPTLYRVKAIG